jgi:putative endonuclease
MCYWVYILRCENNTLYTGCTSDLTRRYEEHCAGTPKCKFTRSFKPIEIAQYWQIRDGKAAAMRVERFIKKRSRLEKEALIVSPSKLAENFPNLEITRRPA